MAHAVALDMFILRRVAALVRWGTRQMTKNRTDHVALLDAWAKGTYAELDYEAEGRNYAYFRKELGQRMGGRVYVPEVCWELTSRRVLATEWVEGPRLADCSPEVIRTLVPVGVECFLAQLLDMGVFHSDPHPGNLLVNKGRLVLIDFGLVAEIGQPSMESMATATVHLISADYEALFDDLVSLELLPLDADRQQVLGSDWPISVHNAARQFQQMSPGSELNKYCSTSSCCCFLLLLFLLFLLCCCS
ncbi:unnamed protein product [Polarella glacialis]|uniref:ABC1 atypical kinase-like domain-containing protein n=1 Tax=Polarella glacialis TaxID=89957 RepID=A0A813G6Q1_POLGL|nr:unnamed protein product [Polarella glacialis]